MEADTLQKPLDAEGRKTERLATIAKDLQGGRKVTDFRFDQVFPPEIRKLSETHWSPVEVAIRAAELLASHDRTRILDVGSGCGKFCLVASLSCPGQYVGVEQRLQLVEVARKAGAELNAKNAAFIQDNMTDLDWSFFDGFYFFNPFYEHKVKEIRIDTTLSYSQDKFVRYVETVRSKLKSARLGTKVVTYHGFGGDMPPGYQCLQKEPIATSYIELWVKTNLPPLGQK
jgi:predicted RNA methylase